MVAGFWMDLLKHSAFQVHAGAEGPLAVSRNDRHLCSLVIPEPPPCVTELPVGHRADAVEDLGPIERDDGHLASLLVPDLRIVYGEPPLIKSGICTPAYGLLQVSPVILHSSSAYSISTVEWSMLWECRRVRMWSLMLRMSSLVASLSTTTWVVRT